MEKESLDKCEKFEIIDGDSEIKLIKGKFLKDLEHIIQSIKVPKTSDPLNFLFFEKNYYFDIIDNSMLSFLDGKYCCSRLLPMINFDNFLFIFMNLLQERSLIFISKKLENLSISM